LVRTGNVIDSFLNPTKLPTNTNGTDTQNHKNNNVKKVLNGKAADDPSIHITMLSAKKTKKTTLGKRNAVSRVFCFQSMPRNIL